MSAKGWKQLVQLTVPLGMVVTAENPVGLTVRCCSLEPKWLRTADGEQKVRFFDLAVGCKPRGAAPALPSAARKLFLSSDS